MSKQLVNMCDIEEFCFGNIANNECIFCQKDVCDECCVELRNADHKYICWNCHVIFTDIYDAIDITIMQIKRRKINGKFTKVVE